MLDTLPNPGPLTVLIGGQSVGTVLVAWRSTRKLLGTFPPAAGFEPYRPVFEVAVGLARQLDALPTDEPCDYLLWDRLMAAYTEINRLVSVFAELPVPIEEFAVWADWSVEVTFKWQPRK